MRNKAEFTKLKLWIQGHMSLQNEYLHISDSWVG